jgi:Fe-S-cluster containining protein
MDVSKGTEGKKQAVKYDCAKCPGYCCSYPRIVITAKDISRLARHFGVSHEEAKKRFTHRYRWASETESIDERVLRHRQDHIYTSTCQFLDQDTRRCTVYQARPAVCRAFPEGRTCGYYQFLKFERRQQGDEDFVPSA